MSLLNFKSLDKALHHRDICPLCNGAMSISGRFLFSDPYDGSLLFEFDHYSSDFIAIDKQTEEVRYVHDNNNIRSGLHYFPLKKECQSCAEYYYIVNLGISLTNLKIEVLELGSEYVGLTEDNIVYEISNNYATKKTCVYSQKQDFLLPLIDIDFDNITNSFIRIKTLITFA